MKTLLLMRHAKSSWKQPELSDYERPLNKRGQRDAPRMGKLLLEQGLTPELILSSSAKRARDTADSVAKACHYDGEPELFDILYEESSGSYLKLLRILPNTYERVLVVGHNPVLESVLLSLTCTFKRMPTAAIAHLELPIQRWDVLRRKLEGTVVNLWTPETLLSD